MASLQRLTPDRHPARPIVDVTPFAVEPPHLGGQVIIRAVNKALAGLGQPVEQYALGIRRGDLAAVGRPRRIEVAPGYVEWRRTEPVSVALFLLTAALRIPHVWAGRALALRPWAQLRQAIAQGSAVMLEMPWCYAPPLLRQRPGTPLVYMSHNAEFQLAADWRGRWAGLGRRLAVELERQEAQVLAAADLTICITPEDRVAMLERYRPPPERLHVLPRGLELDAYALPSTAERLRLRQSLGLADEFVVIFSGSYHPPNLAAARFMCSLAETAPAHWRIIVAGTVAQHLPQPAHPRLWLRPHRASSRQYLPVADVGLNPMTTGSGMNVKMLDYLAWGLPVITTPWGARGIAGVAGQHYLVTDLDAMAGQLELLAGSPEQRARLGAAGRQLVAERYSSTATARDLLALLDDWRRSRVSDAALV